MYILSFHEHLQHIVAPFRRLLPLSFFACLSACISQELMPGEEEMFKEDELTFIEIGKSTKEEIAAAVSDLTRKVFSGGETTELEPIKFKDGNWWLNAQRRGQASGVVFDFADLSESVYGGFDMRYLLIKFDNNGVVAEYELSSSRTDYGCNRVGICVNHPYLSFKAPKEDARLAKRFNSPGDSCGVYVYGKPRPILQIWLDGHRIGGLWRNTFYFKQLEPGDHQLGARGPNELEHVPLDFSCDAGSSVFIELKTEGLSLFDVVYSADKSYELEMVQRDAKEARRAIARSKLMLDISEPSN